jgi:parallel beta-helix repeat protein
LLLVRFNSIEVKASNDYPVHNLDTGLNYTTIQEAINANETKNGHTIFADAGLYYEHVIISKSIRLVGESRDATVIDGSGTGTVISVQGTKSAVVAGFTLKNSGAGLDSCVLLWCAENNTIRDNIISCSSNGILLDKARQNSINGNVISNNDHAIVMDGGFNNIICDNQIMNNRQGVYFIQYARWNTIFHNNFINNSVNRPGGLFSIGNIWDDGYPSGGNYWTDYLGIDLHHGQFQNESGSDAIGDSPYVLDDNNVDNYPLFFPWRIITVPSDYSTIQEAINAADSGDTVFVSRGIYNEHIVLNKTLSLIGESRDTTVIDGNGTGTVIEVIADHTTISRLTIRRGGRFWPDFGTNIWISSSDNVISGNNVTDATASIRVEKSSNRNFISENYVASNFYGIYLTGQNSIISRNSFTGTAGVTIFVLRSRENIITENNLTDIDGCGIRISNAANNLITQNIISFNKGMSIYIEASYYNKVLRNVLINNSIAIGLVDALHGFNVISDNNVKNSRRIFFIASSSSNMIYHNNFIGSAYPPYNYDSQNIWDNGVEGNFWSDYAGGDSDHNGIGDISQVIDENNQDKYPLMGGFQSFNTSLGEYVDVISNSTINDFEYFESNSTIRIYVSNMTSDQIFGFCRVRIPHILMNETVSITVLVNGTEPYYWNYTLYNDGNNRWIYFEYEHSYLEIVIVSEFTSLIILLTFMIATILAVVVYKTQCFSFKT